MDDVNRVFMIKKSQSFFLILLYWVPIISLLILLLPFLVSCNSEKLPNEKALSSYPKDIVTASAYLKPHKITGTVLLKPWSKSPESWNAGGSSYYVLDVGNSEIFEYSAKEGVIIRFGTELSDNEFKKLVGLRVELTGNYVSKKPVQVDPHSQYPTNINGEPLHRGSGFKVRSYRIIDK